MRTHPDRPHPRPAAAMRDGKGLVQVKVADIAANLARLYQTDQRVHVRPVDIDLAAMVMGNLAKLFHRLFKHAVGGRIGDHAGRETVARRRRLLAEVLKVNVPIWHGFHNHHVHPGHLGTGRVGSMRRNGNKAHLAVMLPPRPVIGEDGQKPRIFPLRARIGLHRKRVIAGDLAQLCRQILNRFTIAQRLIGRHKRVQRPKLGPGDWHHLGRGIQLHGA